jgi:hypothetical protein
VKRTRDLELFGTTAKLQSFADHVERVCPPGWTRDKSEEARISKEAFSPMYCFEYKKSSNPAHLWIAYDRKNERLWVANIVPEHNLDTDSERYDYYNGTLLKFWAFAQNVADAEGLKFNLSDEDVTIDTLLPMDAAKKLRAFSRLANMSTGSSHPNDQERWFDFIVSVHKSRVDLDVGTLERLLHEEERWSESSASKLALEYEFARALLEFYDPVSGE